MIIALVFLPLLAALIAGIGNDQTRADVIDYLHTLARQPVPFPAVTGGSAATAAPGPASPQAVHTPASNTTLPADGN